MEIKDIPESLEAFKEWSMVCDSRLSVVRLQRMAASDGVQYFSIMKRFTWFLTR